MACVKIEDIFALRVKHVLLVKVHFSCTGCGRQHVAE